MNMHPSTIPLADLSPVHAASACAGSTILALDLGTTTGWASLINGIVHSGTATFRTGRYDGGGMRYLRFQHWLEQLADEPKGKSDEKRAEADERKADKEAVADALAESVKEADAMLAAPVAPAAEVTPEPEVAAVAEELAAETAPADFEAKVAEIMASYTPDEVRLMLGKANEAGANVPVMDGDDEVAFAANARTLASIAE